MLQIATASPVALNFRTFFKRKTALMLAARGGNVLTVSSLLWAAEQVLGDNYTLFLNESDIHGNTALHVAAKHGHVTILRILLEEGCNPLCANGRGNTPLHLASMKGHASCAELLLDARVQVNGREITASHATTMDAIGETRYIDSLNASGLAPLHLAAFVSSHTTVVVLVEHGAILDVSVARALDRLPYMCGGSTPLHIAASQGDARMCRILLDGQWRHPGVELRRIRNVLGLTPLNCALLGGYHEVVRVLIEAPRRDRVTGRDSAIRNGFPASIRDHMIVILKKASLLVSLRDIALKWKDKGCGKASDDQILGLNGILNLSPEKITKMRRLLENEDVSLRDVLFGLECTLHEGGSDLPFVRLSNALPSSGGDTDDEGQQNDTSNDEKTGAGKGCTACSPIELGLCDTDEDCQICMDGPTEVQFEPCTHRICFSCAAQLCTRPGDVASCPFCRDEIGHIRDLSCARMPESAAQTVIMQSQSAIVQETF